MAENTHGAKPPSSQPILADVIRRRDEAEAAWSNEERAVAQVWDAVKPTDAPLWWCLREEIKEKFRGEALAVAYRTAESLKTWLAGTKPRIP